MNPLRSAFRRFQTRVRPLFFPFLWLPLVVLSFFTPLSDLMLPFVRIGGVPLSLWGLLLLATPLVSLAYWYSHHTPTLIEDGIADLDPGDVALVTHHVHDSTADLNNQRLVSLGDTGSIGLFGASRSGKTEAAKLILHQLLKDANDDTPIVIYDHKDDFQHFLPDDRQIRISARGSDVQWNLFEEVTNEQDCEEIAREMFPPRDDGNFFESAARQLLSSIMMLMLRRANREDTTPTNADLISYIQQRDAQDIIDDIDSETGIPPVQQLIDPEAGAQSQGVLATFQERLRDLFQGDLRNDGHWSLSDYFDAPDGRVLIIDFPADLGQSAKPSFRFLLDLSIKHTLQDNDDAVFLLDEFAQLPRLQRIGPLLNVAAGLDVRALLAFQSVAQLQRQYGDTGADALLSGLLNEVFLRPNDQGMLDYQRDMISTEWQEREQLQYDDDGDVDGKTTQEVEKRPFAKGDLATFDPGECIVVRDDGWCHCQLAMLDDVIEQVDRGLDRRHDDDWLVSDSDLDDLN